MPRKLRLQNSFIKLEQMPKLMKLLAFFSDQDLNHKLPIPNRSGYNVRRAGRAILTNSKGEIALMFVGKHSMYKLPGGGIDENEDIHEGLKREIMEETGCHASIGDEIGITIELRDQWKLAQISYVYRAVVTEETKNFSFTEEEIERGLALKWIPASEAISLMEGQIETNDYDAKYMQKRDLTILKAALVNS